MLITDGLVNATNWGTISNSIKKLQKLNTDLVAENRGFTKKSS